MRVLFLSCHSPYPPLSGGRRREWELLRRLGRRHDVDLCAVTKTYADDLHQLPAIRDVCRQVRLFEATPARGAGVPAQVARHRSPRATAALSSVAEEYDLVHVEGFYLVQHLPPAQRARVLLVEQNVEFTLWHQRARLTLDPREREALIREVEWTREHELKAWARSSICAAVTEEDRGLISRYVPAKPVVLVPDGADHASGDGNRVDPAPPAEVPTVVMVGNFAYQPNLDAGLHLCREIAPLLASRIPGVRVLLVGNGAPDELRDAAAAAGCVSVTGRVPAVEPYLDSATVVACPLRVGGGVKVKVLEALSRGKAVVASPVAAQGLGRAGRRALRIAETPDGFAETVAELVGDARARRRLERAASRYAATLPSWDDAARALEDCWAMAASATRQPAIAG